MTKQYGRRTFEDIVRAWNDEGSDVLHEHWLQIKDDGVYIRPPTAEERTMFSPKELAKVRPLNPTGNPEDPALPFPFTLANLIAFEEEIQLICSLWVDLDGERLTSLTPKDRTVAGREVKDEGDIRVLNEGTKALIEQLLDALEPAERKRTAPREVPKQRAQEDEIRAAIRSLGHDPIKMPPNEPGRPGIKAQVRGITQEKRPDLFTTRKKFEMAWERLRDDKAIKYDGEAAPSD